VASQDWVVAIFPRLFEQIAEWFDIDGVDGFFDVGAAGFRGFTDLGSGSVVNIKFAPGSHGYGVDIAHADRKTALVDFALNGVDDAAMTKAFGTGTGRTTWDGIFDVLSRMSLLIWIGLVAAAGYVGVRLWRVRWWAAAAYSLLVLYILISG
jgi:hypothetical protein